MIATLFLVLILLALAWAAHQFLPHPIGVVFAVICGLIALYVLVTAFVGDTDTAEAALGAPFLGMASSYGRKRKGTPLDLAQILKAFKAEKKLKPKAGLPKLPKRF